MAQRNADSAQVSNSANSRAGASRWLDSLFDRQAVRPRKTAAPTAWEEFVAERVAIEPLPASSGSGVDGHLLMRWAEWAHEIWNRHGDRLLSREREVAEWVGDSDYAGFQPTAVSLLDHVQFRHALFADERPKPTFPYPRNQFAIPMSKSGRLDVLVADYNRFAYQLRNKMPHTALKPSTLALSPFPRSSTLIITPRSNQRHIPLWEALAGPPIERGLRTFDDKFIVYARDEEWARETITRTAAKWLTDFGNIRVLADRETLIAIHLGEWCSVANLDELADISAYVSRSAREALPALDEG
jgi:hypothetical protein